MRILDAWLATPRLIYDPSRWEKAVGEPGQDGIPCLPCCATPWQQLWVEWVDIADLAWHMAEAERPRSDAYGWFCWRDIERRGFRCFCRSRLGLCLFPEEH